ncbi:MAG TPA: glycosyltransferase family 2 protein [Hyphomicrobiaceae bacterium]|nr:glycosyltransferase family 2 protein [Hyphomicrobiaceae bacterium]
MATSRLSYVLITPARNERALIEGTIRSVIVQTLLPTKWVIVSDGSTDGTDELVTQFAGCHPWIELLRMPEHRDRSFAAKATCFNTAFDRLKPTAFDLIANLDADITFEPDYLEFLVGKFAENPKLGVAGTPFIEDASEPHSHSYAHRFADLQHVSGACQMFRRRCLEELGGYAKIKGGGIDLVAVTTARMNGWQTRTFTEKTCVHHRKMGTAGRGPLMARFQHGQEDYAIGQHPLWELMRGLFQMRAKPFVLGGLFLLLGYFWAMIRRVQRPISPELVSFRRAEQMTRLRSMILGRR